MYCHEPVIRGLEIHNKFATPLVNTGFTAIFAIWRNPPSRQKILDVARHLKYIILGGIMLDKRVLEKTKIYTEFDEVENNYWFDFKKSKFLHNIDTFYYSVKFYNDFTYDSVDVAVKNFRAYFSMMLKIFDESCQFSSGVEVRIPGIDEPLNLRPFHYAGYFNICLEVPEYFDIFFAPVVPHSSDGGDSVTCECVVQLRSYMLWMYGVTDAYEKSFYYIRAIADYFNLDIAFTQENRVDYCWHSNYLSNPEKFFNPEDFYKMRVDRFKDALFHTSKVGSSDYEIDYIAMGKRSDKIFIRIYLKSKEVVEKGYKPWFFKIWLFNGLINRYDLYVYEYAFLHRSWKAIDLGRLAYYCEFGRDAAFIKKCQRILSKTDDISPDSLRAFADKLTPKINLVMNVEYQTMRKHTKNYELIPFRSNFDKAWSVRIYDYLDNRKVICEYLTNRVFRLVEPYQPGVNDSNKSRRDMCAFWKALRSCKIEDCFVPETERKLVRTYTRKLNSEVVKSRAIKAAVTYGIYTRGINNDDPMRDCIEALCMMNDNDMKDALQFKNKKIRQFNNEELADEMKSVVQRPNNIIVIDNKSGEIYNYNTHNLEN